MGFFFLQRLKLDLLRIVSAGHMSTESETLRIPQSRKLLLIPGEDLPFFILGDFFYLYFFFYLFAALLQPIRYSRRADKHISET